MPYRVVGRNLEHEKDGKWSVKQRCKSHENALAAMRLLQAKEHNPNFKEKK